MAVTGDQNYSDVQYATHCFALGTRCSSQGELYRWMAAAQVLWATAVSAEGLMYFCIRGRLAQRMLVSHVTCTYYAGFGVLVFCIVSGCLTFLRSHVFCLISLAYHAM